MHAAQKKILAEKTPTRKLRAALRLRQSALELKAAWLRRKHPEWTEKAVHEEVRKAFDHAGY